MPVSDAFVVGEDWISEHYFTTDATSQSFHAKVLERRKAWDAEEATTARDRFTEARGGLERTFAAFASDGDDTDPDTVTKLHGELISVLGFHTGEFVLDHDGPVTWVSSPGLTGAAPLAVISAAAAPTVDDLVAKDARTLAAPYVTGDDDEITSVSRLLSHLFVRDGAPRFALVLAGAWALVAEQERWPEGRYLAVNVQLVAERNDTKRAGEIDRALTILEAHSLGPDADGNVWWSDVLDDSVKHTVGVSKDLREGVRLSIEIIANEVVRRRIGQGLDPLPQDQAQPLAIQSLRYLYRILFLLYAEASPELEVLPAGAAEYDQGYSLDRLRDLTLVDLHTEQSKNGLHLYESLATLFRLVDEETPYAARLASADGADQESVLVFNPLRADLFRPEAIAHIGDVGLGNEALQRVLGHLLLSKESKGKDRGFISYVELGINQLGAVYEGLMSYTGFFAEEDLFEVAKGGDASKGSWVVPTTRADHLDPADFVKVQDEVTGEMRPVRHLQGTFVFRLAGRERQQSASYYTPEVLTRFTVSQALAELLDQDGHTTTAEEILGLTICEPALGSGAFAIEAVRQLAAEYLKRRQNELGERIEPEDYAVELQKVKAHIALHQVHGVDLNATAVELAEVSLWLDTMVKGLSAPWFGLRLRRGNSLIGARRATYSQSQVRDKSWLTSTPTDVPLTELAENIAKGIAFSATSSRIHHFLLPAQGWGSATEVPKDVASLAPEAVAALKAWRKSMKAKPTTKQIQQLTALGERVETLWQFALRRLRIAEAESSRAIELWKRETPVHAPAVTREQIEASLADENGAYLRLREVMDLWCALWFWPLTETEAKPPTLDQWIRACEAILGVAPQARHKWMDTFSADATSWEGLNAEEEDNLNWSGAQSIESVRERHSWLSVAQRISREQGFFHWSLDFATVFAKGGFDLQLGNPPWVRPRTDLNALLAEGDPWWQLATDPSEEAKSARRGATLERTGIRDLVLDGSAEVMVTATLLADPTAYPVLAGQPDLYRAFMSLVWRNARAHAISALVHYESHFTDDKARSLRSEAYHRLRRHWQFKNELKLFEIQNQKTYGVNIYGDYRPVRFMHAAGLYHPETLARSFAHDGSGPMPGLKDERGNWDVRPHLGRIQHVDDQGLAVWAAILEYDGPAGSAPMVYLVNAALQGVLAGFETSSHVKDLSLHFSRGWDENLDRKKGRFRQEWGAVASWDDVILQSLHLGVQLPLNKYPNRTLKNHRDWAAVDLEVLAPDQMPITGFKRVETRAKYASLYPRWGKSGEWSPLDYFRIAWRSMIANEGERTFMAAIIPPGAGHVHTVMSAGEPDDVLRVAVCAGVFSSLLSDFAIRVAPKSTISANTVSRLPMVSIKHPLISALLLRVLRLNCLTNQYAQLWEELWSPDFATDSPVLPTVSAVPPARSWREQTPLRRDRDRRNAQVEVDALVALMLEVKIEDLCAIYRSEFPVLRQKDAATASEKFIYDSNGRLVPNSVLTVWRKEGDSITEDERKAIHPGSRVEYTYELPFGTLDREADMRTAYAEFERRLAQKQGT
ncbi:class I SAM-dependent DNA methyltransferase [Terrabacter ginsenosidimutans]|uniref:site-specific DNA-methyltransferase (adenine-specific) n=1 Tax=Terrabacter ginsenosidimutans TaxID=490575 RepID=A0ABP7CTU7_9MICO